MVYYKRNLGRSSICYTQGEGGPEMMELTVSLEMIVILMLVAFIVGLMIGVSMARTRVMT